MSEIQLIVDGETVFASIPIDTGTTLEEEVEEVEELLVPKVGDDEIIVAQARRRGDGVYFQARFADGSRQSIRLDTPVSYSLEGTLDPTTVSPQLSLAGEGNHYYTSAILVGYHVFANGTFVGTLPDGWDEGRK